MPQSPPIYYINLYRHEDGHMECSVTPMTSREKAREEMQDVLRLERQWTYLTTATTWVRVDLDQASTGGAEITPIIPAALQPELRSTI